jgi:hypothetical protein
MGASRSEHGSGTCSRVHNAMKQPYRPLLALVHLIVMRRVSEHGVVGKDAPGRQGCGVERTENVVRVFAAVFHYLPVEDDVLCLFDGECRLAMRQSACPDV